MFLQKVKAKPFNNTNMVNQIMTKSDQKIRDIVFPIIRATKTHDGIEFKRLLGTGFLVEKSNLCFTSSNIFQDKNIKNIYCLFVISNKWEALPITKIVHNEILNISSFFITRPPYESWLNISKTEHHASCNFMLWGYPDEYLLDNQSDNQSDNQRPDLAYHQGYIIRRLSNILSPKGTELFEINLVLSEGCYGSPLIIRDGNWGVIGIYIGSYKFIINKSYKNILNLINKDDNFWEKLKSDKENRSILNVFDIILSNSLTSLGIRLIYDGIKKYKTNDSEIKIFTKVISSKEDLKDILNQIMDLMNEQISINYGLAVRLSGFDLNCINS
jgi:hypothetical protein